MFVDASTRHGVTVAAYYLGPDNYGAVVAANTNSFDGELLALSRGTAWCPPAAQVFSDCETLVGLVHHHQQATLRPTVLDRHPDLAAVLGRMDTRQLLVAHVRGHGPDAPPGMVFVDVLSRYLARHLEQLHLRPGDVLRAGSGLPVLVGTVGPDVAVHTEVLGALNRTLDRTAGLAPRTTRKGAARILARV